MTDPESPHRQEALSELLKKLRVQQEDILRSAHADSFVAYIRHVELDPRSQARRALYKEAFQFLKGAASFDAERLPEELARRAPLLAEMRRYYPEESDECSWLDYLSFVGARIGEIPEDLFALSHPADPADAGPAAVRSLELTARLVEGPLPLGPDDPAWKK